MDAREWGLGEGCRIGRDIAFREDLVLLIIDKQAMDLVSVIYIDIKPPYCAWAISLATCCTAEYLHKRWWPTVRYPGFGARV